VKRFIFSILVGLTLLCGFTGCTTTSTERRALQVVQTTTKAADAVLDAYAVAAVLGKLTPAEERKIVALDEDYRKAKTVLRAAVIAYKSAPQDERNLRAATDALQAIIAAILSLPKSP
jgi:hypothetical protein